jgi:hypothetical protein
MSQGAAGFDFGQVYASGPGVQEVNSLSVADALIWYNRHGLAAYPAHSAQKMLTLTKGYQFDKLGPLGEDALATVAGAYQQHPDLRVALICGEASGLAAIDVDDLDQWARLREEYGIGDKPLTAWQTTGREGGGLTLVFRRSGIDGELLRQGPWSSAYPGVELKTKGPIIAAPSMHASGRRYQWQPGPGEPAEISSTLLRRRAKTVRHGCPYRESDGAIVWDKPTQHGTSEMPLTNFLAKISGHTIIDDGSGEVRREFEITASLGGKPRVFSIPADRFASMNWATEHLGPAAIVRPGMGVRDHARAAVQMLSGDGIPQRHIFAHTGWRQLPGGWGYLTASGAMTADGLDTSVTVDLGPLSGYWLPEVPDLPALQNAIRASLAILEIAPDQVTVPVLAAVYRAPLPLPADCSGWLAGESGIYKTSVLALAQQHFGAGMGEGALPGNWTSTGNNLEMQAFCLDGVVFVVDDYSPDVSRFEAQKRAAAAERLLRGAANHSARGRLRADGSMRPPKPPRAQVLTSAEDLPPAGVSLRARVMIFEAWRGAVSVDGLLAAQGWAADGLLAQAMAGYSRHLASVLDRADLRATLRSDLYRFRDTARAQGHPRTALNIASFALGWDQWTQYAEAAGVIRPDERFALMSRAWSALCALGAGQARYSRDADPAGVYLRALGSLIASGRAHLADPAGQVPAGPERWGWAWDAGQQVYRPGGRRIGWTDGGNVYLDPEGSYVAAVAFAEESRSPLGLSKHALHKLLDERGLLASRADAGHYTAKRDLDGKPGRRVLHLTVSSFEYPPKQLQRERTRSVTTPGPQLPPKVIARCPFGHLIRTRQPAGSQLV